METANTVIVDALQQILVQASEASIQADEAQTAIRYMNRYMARLDAKGIDLGYTVVSTLADPITIPDGAVDGLVTNLAVALAPQYDVPLTQGLLLEAKSGQDAMLAIAFSIGPICLARWRGSERERPASSPAAGAWETTRTAAPGCSGSKTEPTEAWTR